MGDEPICVLGMHRSGTSCLMGSLEQAGLYLGQVNRQAQYNPKGNRESAAIIRLNTAVLANTGHSWRNPPTGAATWSRADREDRDAIIARFAGAGRWGFKDPRTVFTLEGWLEALPGMCLVGSIRHPMAVARSLENRGGMPLAQGLDLWAQYNLRLLELHEAHEFPIVSFDLPQEAYEKSVERVARQFELPAPERSRFFEDEHRHEVPQNGDDLAPFFFDLYQELLDVASS
jgi:hypothetical protein